jgi:hypothetical protein
MHRHRRRRILPNRQRCKQTVRRKKIEIAVSERRRSCASSSCCPHVHSRARLNKLLLNTSKGRKPPTTAKRGRDEPRRTEQRLFRWRIRSATPLSSTEAKDRRLCVPVSRRVCPSIAETHAQGPLVSTYAVDKLRYEQTIRHWLYRRVDFVTHVTQQCSHGKSPIDAMGVRLNGAGRMS